MCALLRFLTNASPQLAFRPEVGFSLMNESLGGGKGLHICQVAIFREASRRVEKPLSFSGSLTHATVINETDERMMDEGKDAVIARMA